MQKINKKQKERINFLINNNLVSDWDKTLLKNINFKNVSIAENHLFIEIFKRYELLK